MSHDVWIQRSATSTELIPLARVRAVLDSLGLREGDGVWTMSDPHLEVYPCMVEDGDVSDALAERHPGSVNRIDTHLPWEELKSSEAAHRATCIRIAMARKFDWVALDLQAGEVVADSADGHRFGGNALPVGARRSIPVQQLGRETKEVARPKARIVAKDSNDGYCRTLVPDGEGGWIAGFVENPRFNVHRPPSLQFRNADVELVHELVGLGGSVAANPSRRLALTSGPMLSGAYGVTQLVDLDERSVIDSYPTRPPFVWLDEHTFCALAPSPDYSSGRDAVLGPPPRTAKDLLTPQFRALYQRATFRGILRVDTRTRELTVVGDAPICDETNAGPRTLAASLDGNSLFVGTQTGLWSLEASTGSVRWRRSLGRYDGERAFHSIQALAPSPCGRYVATASVGTTLGHPHELVVARVEDGSTVLALELQRIAGSTPCALAWHPSGWLAVGTTAGAVALLDLGGTVRSFKASPRGIDSLVFSPDGASLLVAGTEKAFRVFALLPDEIAGGPG